MKNGTREAALQELKHCERAVMGVQDVITIENIRLIKYAQERQNVAMRRLFEYAEACALEA